MSSNLSYKQRVFTTKIIEGKNGTQAAMVAYDVKNANTAGVIAYENLRKPKIMEEISKTLDAYGLFEECIQALADGMKATKHNAQLDVDFPDHVVRLKAATMGINLWFVAHGHRPPL